MPIVIPKRGTPKPPPGPKKPVILPPKAGTALSASAFAGTNLSKIAKLQGEPATPAGIRAMALPEAAVTGINLDLDALLAKHPLPLTPMGEKFVLKDWQREDISALAGWSRVGAFLPVGSGKTVIATMVALAYGDEHRVVIVQPILVKQWVQWINSIPGTGGAIAYEGTIKQRNALELPKFSWWVMSYGIFRNDHEKLMKLCHGVKATLVVDECFPAGTLIATPEGERDISNLRIGDKVCTSNGVERILHVFKSLAKQLVELEFSDGTRVVCTPNHPVFTDRGWIAARDCLGRKLVPASMLRNVRLGIQEEEAHSVLGSQGEDRCWVGLFQTLRSESTATSPRSRAYSENEHGLECKGGQEQPHRASETFKRSSQGDSVSKAEGARPEGAGWQRDWHDGPREGIGAFSSAQGVRLEPCNLAGQKDAWLSDQLQNGLCKSSNESCFRGRRKQSPGAGSSGSKEGAKASGIRVERVSHIECESPVPVFNLEVENTPHYFAGGVLVHNCQNIKDPQSQLWKKCNIFSLGQKLILMTGTELNSPADAYGYIKIKTPTVYRSWGQFTNIHVVERDFFENPVKWGQLELLNRNLYLQSAQRTKEEVHSHLPKANYIPFPYDLAPEHLKLYNELADQQLLELESGGKIDGTTAQAIYLYTQQIIIDWARFSGKPDVRPAAFDVVDTLLDQMAFGTPAGPKKFIIWTWFKNSTKLVSQYMQSLYPGRVVLAYSDSDSKKAVAAFMEDPECWVLVAQPMSAGAGLNPQYVCYNALFLEFPTRTILFRQSAGRIDREGQRFNANIWIAKAEGTIQTSMYNNLLKNDELVQTVQGTGFDLRRIIHGG